PGLRKCHHLWHYPVIRCVDGILGEPTSRGVDGSCDVAFEVCDEVTHGSVTNLSCRKLVLRRGRWSGPLSSSAVHGFSCRGGFRERPRAQPGRSSLRPAAVPSARRKACRRG